MAQMIHACTCPECEGQEVQFDNVTNPKHYQGIHGLEAIEVHKNFMTEEELRGYYKGNALKYLLRDWMIGMEESK